MLLKRLPHRPYELLSHSQPITARRSTAWTRTTAGRDLLGTQGRYWRYPANMDTDRKLRPQVDLGLHDETVAVGDHLAMFYETEEEFAKALDFIDVGLRTGDHCVLFGIPADTERMLTVLRSKGWDVEQERERGRLSMLPPEMKCDATVASVSRHFAQVLASGPTLIRLLGNAAVGCEGWPSEQEFYKLEGAVSAATRSLPCVAICMFDLRTQPARTIMKAAFEGHPVTIHRNCVRENPLYVPRAEAAR
jgi:hypothetical protein